MPIQVLLKTHFPASTWSTAIRKSRKALGPRRRAIQRRADSLADREDVCHDDHLHRFPLRAPRYGVPRGRPRARRRGPRPARLPRGRGGLQEEGRSPHHHPRVHRAEGVRRRRHVPIHDREGQCRARTPKKRFATSTSPPSAAADKRHFSPICTETLCRGLWFLARFRSSLGGVDGVVLPGPRVSRAAKDASRPARSPRPPTPGSRRPSMEHSTDDAPRPNPPPPILPQNRRNTSQRVELMKYNPYLRKHTLHRELKK